MNPSLDGEAAVEGHQRELRQVVEPLEERPKERHGPERLSHVLGEHGDDGTLGGQGDPREPRPALPHDLCSRI